MNRLENLHHLIDCLEDMLKTRVHFEKLQSYTAFQRSLWLATQKISLAEKEQDVKNTRSHESSEEQ